MESVLERADSGPDPLWTARRTREEGCVDVLVQFLDWLPAARKADQRTYYEFARRHPGSPSAATFNRTRRPGMVVLLDRARTRRLQGVVRGRFGAAISTRT
jgi:hypothetical protein